MLPFQTAIKSANFLQPWQTDFSSDDLHHRHLAYMLMKSYQRIILAN